jgi:hypothetical protein
MGMSAFIVRDGDEEHRTLISDRDIGLLSGPLFTEGPIFSFTYGFYENFTVARGIPPGSHVVRPAQKLYTAASALLRAIERDIELLTFDYSFAIDDELAKEGPEVIFLRGREGLVLTHPKGFCHIEISETTPKGKRVLEVVDLRVLGDFVTDGPMRITVHHKAATLNWAEVLPPLVAFLRPRIKKRLVVEHIDRVG